MGEGGKGKGWQGLHHSLSCHPPPDVDECVGEQHCAPRGECLNSLGSFFCLCAPGFTPMDQATHCQGEKP